MTPTQGLTDTLYYKHKWMFIHIPKNNFEKRGKIGISTYIDNASGWISGIAFGKNIFNLAIINGITNVKGFNYGSSSGLGLEAF